MYVDADARRGKGGRGRGKRGEGRGLKAVESCYTYLFVSFSIAIASEEGKSPGFMCIYGYRIGKFVRNVEKLRYLDTCLDTLEISLALVIGVGVVVGRSTRRALMNHSDEMTDFGCRHCSSLRVRLWR